PSPARAAGRAEQAATAAEEAEAAAVRRSACGCSGSARASPPAFPSGARATPSSSAGPGWPVAAAAARRPAEMARKEERSMSSSAERALGIALGVATLLPGCYSRHGCGEERCNLVDDDCDGRIDEDFLGDDGEYRSVEHCGECGIDCRAAFPTASEVACEQDEARGPVCVLVSCPAGFHRG